MAKKIIVKCDRVRWQCAYLFIRSWSIIQITTGQKIDQYHIIHLLKLFKQISTRSLLIWSSAFWSIFLNQLYFDLKHSDQSYFDLTLFNQSYFDLKHSDQSYFDLKHSDQSYFDLTFFDQSYFNLTLFVQS